MIPSLFCLFYFFSFRIEGVVIDHATGKPLEGVNVVVEGTHYGASSDSKGRFTIKGLSKGRYRITASFVGYEKQTKRVLLSKETVQINFFLKPVSLPLPEVVVRGKKRESTSRIELPGGYLRRFAGGITSDLFHSLQALPGILPVYDLLGFYVVRGGAPDENGVYIEGGEVLYPYHFFGLEGIFNPDIIDKVDVYLGAFPCEWGEFLSSIIQITPKGGKREGSFSFDIANSSIYYGTRILPKTSLSISYRRTYYDLLAEPLIEMPLPNYYDTQLRLEFTPEENQNLSINYLRTRDLWHIAFSYFYEEGEKIDFTEGDDFLSLNWWAKYGRIEPSFIFYYNQRIQDLEDSVLSYYGWHINEHLKLYGIHLKGRLLYKFSNTISLRAGGNGSFSDFKFFHYENYPLSGRPLCDTFTKASESSYYGSLFTEVIIVPYPLLTLNGGLRYDRIEWTGEDKFSPRMNIEYRAMENLFFKASFGIIHQQPYRLLRYFFSLNDPVYNPGYMFKFDLKAKSATHSVLGFEYHPREDILLRCEGYYKIFYNLITRRLIEYEEYEYRNGGYGYAEGVELLFQKRKGDISGWMSYALSLSKRKEDRDSLFSYSSFDQRHTFNLSLDYSGIRDWSFSLTFRLASGRPCDSAVIRRDRYYDLEYIPKGTRLPFYHRLDLRIEKRYTYKMLRPYIYIEIINLYNRKNAVDVNYWIDYKGKLHKEYITGVPIIPLLGCGASF